MAWHRRHKSAVSKGPPNRDRENHGDIFLVQGQGAVDFLPGMRKFCIGFGVTSNICLM